MRKLLSWFTLFASTGTLFCCALPSLFVVLGMGATMAGFVSAFPELIWLSKNKTWIFLASGMMLFFASYFHYQTRNEPCPMDPKLAKTCQSSRTWSFRILILSIFIWLTGAFFAFIAPILF